MGNSVWLSRMLKRRCMVKVCASGKRKVKATKAMPAKWRQMDDRQRTFMLAHLSIPREIVKCCGPCFKRISKKLDMLFAGDLQNEMAKFEMEIHQTWQSGEISRLQSLVAQYGTDWCTISGQMQGRSMEDCRLQYEALCKKEEEEEEDFEEDADNYNDRQEDDIAMEEDTQDVPESSVVTVQDGDLDVYITEVPTTSNATVFDITPIDVKPKEDAQPSVEQSSISTGLVKGSITAGTPFRPPSVSIIEQPPSTSQLATNATPATMTSQPSTTQAMLSGLDQNTLMQIHQLFGNDENRTRAIIEQYQQQQRNYQQYQQQFVQQQPSMDQLYLTYSQLSEADLNRIYPTVDIATRCVIEFILQHKKQTATLQMRQQHAAMLGQIQAKQMEARQLEQQRQEQRLQQEKQRQIDAARKQLQEQIKHHDITAANIDKNTIAMVHRVGEINQSLQTASLTQLQRQQLLLEYSSQSAKCSSNQLDALNAGSGSAAVVASMSLSASPMVMRTHDTSMLMDDEQRLREEIEKIDEDIRGMEKQVRRLEEEERTYQKKKI
ncbi:Myb-like DNA-binding domain protein, partial [Teladorsagia circumcincta]